jgi:hypothetical protein
LTSSISNSPESIFSSLSRTKLAKSLGSFLSFLALAFLFEASGFEASPNDLKMELKPQPDFLFGYTDLSYD